MITEAEPHRARFTCCKHKMIMSCHLGPYLRGVDCLLFAMHNVVVDAVFDVRGSIWNAVQSFSVGLVLGKEQAWSTFAVEPTFAKIASSCHVGVVDVFV